MKNNIGVMQGRLLPKYKNLYQAHPVNYWKEEFDIAKEIGLNCIEFILDFDSIKHNPLLREDGIFEINKVVDRTGVKVKTVCADYFIEAPLHSENIKTSEYSQKVLIKLLSNVKNLDVNVIVIPCLEKSTLKDRIVLDSFIEKMKPIVEAAEKFKINLSLETDLQPNLFFELLERFDSEMVTVNYDIGNSAALEYDPDEELEAYGNKITDIHIKDRVFGGGPVTLGEGNADFSKFFNKLKEFDYQGPFIMQAYRDEEGIEIFKKQLSWISKYLNEWKVKAYE